MGTPSRQGTVSPAGEMLLQQSSDLKKKPSGLATSRIFRWRQK